MNTGESSHFQEADTVSLITRNKEFKQPGVRRNCILLAVAGEFPVSGTLFSLATRLLLGDKLECPRGDKGGM